MFSWKNMVRLDVLEVRIAHFRFLVPSEHTVDSFTESCRTAFLSMYRPIRAQIHQSMLVDMS